jgi:hypothetical protein
MSMIFTELCMCNIVIRAIFVLKRRIENMYTICTKKIGRKLRIWRRYIVNLTHVPMIIFNKQLHIYFTRFKHNFSSK